MYIFNYNVIKSIEKCKSKLKYRILEKDFILDKNREKYTLIYNKNKIVTCDIDDLLNRLKTQNQYMLISFVNLTFILLAANFYK